MSHEPPLNEQLAPLDLTNPGDVYAVEKFRDLEEASKNAGNTNERWTQAEEKTADKFMKALASERPQIAQAVNDQFSDPNLSGPDRRRLINETGKMLSEKERQFRLDNKLTAADERVVDEMKGRDIEREVALRDPSSTDSKRKSAGLPPLPAGQTNGTTNNQNTPSDAEKSKPLENAVEKARKLEISVKLSDNGLGNSHDGPIPGGSSAGRTMQV